MIRFSLFVEGNPTSGMSSGPVSSPSLVDGSVLSQRISKFSGSNLGAVHEPILPPSTIDPHKLMAFPDD